MIVVDYNHLFIAVVMAELKGRTDIPVEIDLMRHMVLNSLRSYKQKFGAEYGELVIASDNKNNWRRDVFTHYKANRKKARDESTLDWEALFECLNTLRNELDQFFPYKVLHIDKCEADDIIAVLAKWTQTNDLAESMFEAEPKPFLIMSRDGDFIQLQKYSNVKQWSPIDKKYIKSDNSPAMFLYEKIVRGDAGDGVPSVLCPDDFLVNKEQYGRAPPVNKNVIERFKNLDHVKEDEKKRFKRNETVIDFEYIPQEIQEKIINTYVSQPKKDRSQLLNYFIKNKLKNMMNEISSF